VVGLSCCPVLLLTLGARLQTQLCHLHVRLRLELELETLLQRRLQASPSGSVLGA
jgi:hypothetical protein